LFQTKADYYNGSEWSEKKMGGFDDDSDTLTMVLLLPPVERELGARTATGGSSEVERKEVKCWVC
jgi:hypothetical protein